MVVPVEESCTFGLALFPSTNMLIVFGPMLFILTLAVTGVAVQLAGIPQGKFTVLPGVIVVGAAGEFGHRTAGPLPCQLKKVTLMLQLKLLVTGNGQAVITVCAFA